MTIHLNNTDESDCSGWTEFFENNQLRKRLIGFAEFHLPVQDKADAEDIYQMAMLRAFNVDPHRIDDKVNYLIKIVQNLCYDRNTRPWRLSPALTVLLDAQHNEENEELLPMQIPDPKRGPALDAEVKEQNEKYLRTLALHCTNLTERERKLLRWRLRGYTNEEIAAAWGEDVKVIRADMNAVIAKIRYRVQSKKRNPGNES